MNPFPEGFPFPPFWNLHQQSQSAPQAIIPPNETPARVSTAMQFLNSLTLKTQNVVAGNSMSLEQFDGPEITLEERQAQIAACGLIAKYFDGKLEPDAWERCRGWSYQVAQDKLGMSDHPAIKEVSAPCFSCCDAGEVRKSCRYCRGTGKMKIHVMDVGDALSSEDD